MNISTIAALAGVSPATVSRYLNHGYVSEEKRKKIQEVIKQTGYTPSSSAQTLRTGRNNLIGVIVPKISSESVARMVDGITEAVSHSSYQVLLANTGNNTERELEYLKLFRVNNVDGVIFIGTLMSKKHLAVMRSYKKPIVLLGQQEEGVSSLYFDDYGAAVQATECLIRCGCQRIAHIGVTLRDKAAGRNRRSGYLDTLQNHKLPMEDALIAECGFSATDGMQGMAQLLERGVKFDGLFCATDTIAIGAIQYCRSQGLRVPEDVMVASVGDSRAGRVAYVPLTSAHLHYRTAGDKAARLLLDQLADLFVERHAFDQFRGAPPVLRGDGLRPGGIQHEGRQYGKDAIFHR